jgi:hypothetical protein
LGFFVKAPANAVPAKLAHHRKAVALGKLLNRMANVTQMGTGLDLLNAFPHGVVRDLGQALGRNRGLAHHEHAARVAMPAIFDGGDVHVERVALFERLVVRNAVADLVVDRGADRLGVGLVATRRVVERSRDAALHIDHVVVAQLVNLVGGDARLDEGLDVVEDFRSQAACHAHAFDVFGGFDGDRHGVGLSQTTNAQVDLIGIQNAIPND